MKKKEHKIENECNQKKQKRSSKAKRNSKQDRLILFNQQKTSGFKKKNVIFGKSASKSLKKKYEKKVWIFKTTLEELKSWSKKDSQ